MAGQVPNHYALSGQGPLQVTYDSTSFSGKPLLSYHDARQALQFSGSDIRQADSDAGTLVSVTIVRTIDTGSTTFSLLIPRVTLWNGQPAQIRTIGITALHRLTIDTPAHGQLDTYHLHQLSGTASLLES